MEKGEVYSSFLQKELNTSVILIILIIIIAPRQLGNHPMQLGLHNSAFKNSNLSIYGYISTIEGDTRGVFNNASARSAIECFLSERRCSPRCLQALAIQVDRCIARKSKMATKTIMVFVRYYASNIFRFDFRNDDVCFFVWVYEIELFELKVGRCFALISNQL